MSLNTSPVVALFTCTLCERALISICAAWGGKVSRNSEVVPDLKEGLLHLWLPLITPESTRMLTGQWKGGAAWAGSVISQRGNLHRPTSFYVTTKQRCHWVVCHMAQCLPGVAQHSGSLGVTELCHHHFRSITLLLMQKALKTLDSHRQAATLSSARVQGSWAWSKLKIAGWRLGWCHPSKDDTQCSLHPLHPLVTPLLLGRRWRILSAIAVPDGYWRALRISQVGSLGGIIVADSSFCSELFCKRLLPWERMIWNMLETSILAGATVLFFSGLGPQLDLADLWLWPCPHRAKALECNEHLGCASRKPELVTQCAL